MQEEKLYYVDGTKLCYNGGRFYRYADEKYTSDLHFHFYNKVITPLHAHDYFEIFIITHGSVSHTFQDETRSLSEGTACLIAPYEQHQFHLSSGNPVHFNISIPTANFKNLCDTIDPAIYDELVLGRRIHSMNQREFDYYKQLFELSLTVEGKHSDAIAKIITVNLINSFFVSSKDADDRPEWFRNFMEKIKSSEYFLQPISALYKLAPYSQPILNSTFKQFEGETLISYLTKLRINYAANLLICSNYSILDVSEQTGYNSLSHFNHTFKQTLGCTPSDYRKKFGKPDAK